MPPAEAAETSAPTLGALRRTGDLLTRVPRGVWLGVAALWMVFIWRLSGGTPPDTPVGFFWATLGNLVHAPLFGLLALWLALALPRGGPRPRWPLLSTALVGAVVVLVGLYGAVDEWHQSLVPGRTPSVRDLGIDLVGAYATLAVARYVSRAEAREAGVHRRLLAASAACIGAALVAAV